MSMCFGSKAFLMALRLCPRAGDAGTPQGHWEHWGNAQNLEKDELSLQSGF